MDALFKQCRSHFQSIHLPSHDHYHHFRVWLYARELIGTLSKEGINIPDHIIEEIILAVFFHDVGMSVTLNESHGKISAGLFSDFISARSYKTEADIEEINRAVGRHDQKNYENVPFEEAFAQNNILSTVLNISDDLDAFGFIGIYRYMEIYLLRKIKPDFLAGKVIPNLTRRFSNISFTLGKIASFVSIHQIRYQQTLDFYNDLQDCGYSNESPQSGPAGIVKLISDNVINKKVSLNQLIESQPLEKHDEYIRNFIQRYKQEEDNFRINYPDH